MTEEKIASLRQLLSKMNVPDTRKSFERGQNLRWLIDNLKVRNASHAKYNETFELLLELGLENNILSKSELRRYATS
jgi:hypothetical protein